MRDCKLNLREEMERFEKMEELIHSEVMFDVDTYEKFVPEDIRKELLDFGGSLGMTKNLIEVMKKELSTFIRVLLQNKDLNKDVILSSEMGEFFLEALEKSSFLLERVLFFNSSELQKIYTKQEEK